MSESIWEFVLLEDGRFAVYRDGVFKGYTMDMNTVNFNEFMGKDDETVE